MTDRPDLTALLGSRICHDLISPIGAIGNGVELLIMDGASKGPEIALISESVANANAKIRFFRVAFGASSPDQRIGRPEITTILADLTRGARLAIDWQGPPDISRREAKLAFLAIMCLETAMAYGGRITVERVEGQWIVSGQAPKLKVDHPLWDVLSHPETGYEIGAAQVHFALAAQEAQSQDRRLRADIQEDQILLAF